MELSTRRDSIICRLAFTVIGEVDERLFSSKTAAYYVRGTELFILHGTWRVDDARLAVARAALGAHRAARR